MYVYIYVCVYIYIYIYIYIKRAILIEYRALTMVGRCEENENVYGDV